MPDPIPEETTLHEDDSVSLSTVEVFSGTTTESLKRLYRVDKDPPNGDGGDRTRYSFQRTQDDLDQILVEVTHGDTSEGADKPPASIADLIVARQVDGELRSLLGPTEKQLTEIHLPQTWYTYKDTDTGEEFTVVIKKR